MNQLSKEIYEFCAFLEQAPTHISNALQAVVFKNVEDYLDSLQDVSPEEEIRMLNRRARVQESSHKLYRERLVAFKTENRELVQKTGDEVMNQHVFQNPLRVALIDESILQLFQMAEEISALIKSQKMDGPSLTVIAEKAVTLAIREDALPEVRRKLSELTTYVVERTAKEYHKSIQGRVDSYVHKVVRESFNNT